MSSQKWELIFFYKILFVQNSQKYFFLKFYRIMFICSLVPLNLKTFILCLFLYNPYIKHNILTHLLRCGIFRIKRKKPLKMSKNLIKKRIDVITSIKKVELYASPEIKRCGWVKLSPTLLLCA